MEDEHMTADTTTLPDPERTALQGYLLELADDEHVHGERYLDWLATSPTLEANLTVANISQDEIGHAQLWYDLLEDLDVGTPDELVFERDREAFRHAAVVELPFEPGQWGEAVVRLFLYDTAESYRIQALRESVFDPIQEVIEKAAGEEKFHVNHSRTWLESLSADEEGRDRIQAGLDAVVPYALVLFETDADESALLDADVVSRSLASCRRDWARDVLETVEDIDADPPDSLQVAADGGDVTEFLPDVPGRGGEHLPAWNDLHDEFTSAYRKYDYSNPSSDHGT